MMLTVEGFKLPREERARGKSDMNFSDSDVLRRPQPFLVLLALLRTVSQYC